MQNKIQTKLQKIKQFSMFLRVICKLLLGLVTVVGIACVVCAVFGVGGINYGGRIFQTAALTLGHRLVLGAVTALMFAVMFKCFYHLHQLFGNYSHGEIFTTDSVGQLRQFGIACLLWGLMNFVWGLSLALSTHPSKSFPGHADTFVIGVIIIVIASFMDMAVDLHEENELTI